MPPPGSNKAKATAVILHVPGVVHHQLRQSTFPVDTLPAATHHDVAAHGLHVAGQVLQPGALHLHVQGAIRVNVAEHHPRDGVWPRQHGCFEPLEHYTVEIHVLRRAGVVQRHCHRGLPADFVSDEGREEKEDPKKEKVWERIKKEKCRKKAQKKKIYSK